MIKTRSEIRFVLNDRDIVLKDVRPGETLLDFLRLDQRLTGTKEGCAEGDCGACTVLVGRLFDRNIVYETVNACIRFLASLDCCHIVTIEHLAGEGGGFHPVQQAMVDHHGSQCGFCTPGFVMSIYAHFLSGKNATTGAIEQALQGNLCRCTGYEPILKAAKAVFQKAKAEDDPLSQKSAEIRKRLLALNDGARVAIKTDGESLFLPADRHDLARLYVDNPDAVLVAGATDVGLWVTKFMRPISPAIFIGHLSGLAEIHVLDEKIVLGPCVTYSAFKAVIFEHFPAMKEGWSRIGGEQVRNMGTIGGNIANGSPIGDMPPALMALGATLTLRLGDQRREVLLEDFFLAYGRQDRKPGEFIEAIEIPKLAADAHFAFYKISKRRDEDISSVSIGLRVVVDGDIIKEAALAFGGMAAIPKRARKAEASLIGEIWSIEAMEAAAEALLDDFTPLSDMRASAAYRLLVAQNLLKRFFHERAGERVRLSREEIA